MSINLYRRLLQLLPQQPTLTATVSHDYGDGTAQVTLDHGAGQARLKNPLGFAVDAHVYIQGGAITGQAPSMTAVLIEV